MCGAAVWVSLCMCGSAEHLLLRALLYACGRMRTGGVFIILFYDQECACSVHFLTSKLRSTNVFYTDFMESSALMARTVCPFKFFIFLQCWRIINTSQLSL